MARPECFDKDRGESHNVRVKAEVLFTFVQTYRDFLEPLIYLTDQQDWTISLGLKPTIALFCFIQKTFVRGIALMGLTG